jgi:hypothetical protein
MLCMFLSARVELLLEETARRTLLANPLVSWTTSNVNGKMTQMKSATMAPKELTQSFRLLFVLSQIRVSSALS